MIASSTTLNSHFSDYLNTTVIFGEVRKTIISKDFKGGRVSNVFGETVLDFTNADISGVVMLDISQAFGEVKITVPADWQIQTDMSHFLSVIKDKRAVPVEVNKAVKVLMIIGNSAFGAVKIKNKR